MKTFIACISFFVSMSWMVPGYTDEDTDWSGELSLLPIWGGPQGGSFGIELLPKVEHEWAGNNSLTAQLKLRLDSDDNRNLFNIQELYWEKYWEEWEVQVGWLIKTPDRTEAVHLIGPLYNQVDGASSVDREEKFGQPGVYGTRFSDHYGTFEGGIMLGLHQQTYSDEFRVSKSAEFEAGQYNVSLVFHWGNAFLKDKLELGATYFYGTRRDPDLIPRITPSGLEFTQFYPRVHQAAIDWQWELFGKYLFKGELIGVTGGMDDYFAATYGFEETFWNVGDDSGINLSWIVEHLFDSRDDELVQPFNNDIAGFIQVRKFDWSVLFGTIIDPSSGETFFSLEYEHRLTADGRWTVNIESRYAVNANKNSSLGVFKGYIRAGLTLHFLY